MAILQSRLTTDSATFLSNRSAMKDSVANLKKRLAAHNAGQSPHTSKYKPWLLESYFSFKEEGVARAFEKYLKTGSGKAFINRHIMPK